MTDTTTTAAPAMTPVALSRAVDEAARDLVNREVHYCVSSLVSTLMKAAYLDGNAADLIRSDIADDTTLAGLAMRSPDEDDYADAAREAGVMERITVKRDQFGVWCFVTRDEDGDEDDRGTADGTEAGAWREAFDSMGLDHPDGSEVYEHWLVSDWFADKLEAHGETVARDIGGMTIWGRATTGQAIYADHVVQEIARALHDLPRDADLIEAAENATCRSCGRPEMACSAAPCAAVIADRNA